MTQTRRSKEKLCGSFRLTAHSQFLKGFDVRGYPEFSTGNGKIDLLINYARKTYGLELKSDTTHKDFQKALNQAADYAKQLQIKDIDLIEFVESINDANRSKYEVSYRDEKTGVRGNPVFVEIGVQHLKKN